MKMLQFVVGSIGALLIAQGAFAQGGKAGLLAIDVKVSQNLKDIDGRALERLKISALEEFFELGDRWQVKADFVSYQFDQYRIQTDRVYRVQQIQLASAEITSITPLNDSFVMKITANLGLGLTPTNWVDKKELYLSDAEFQTLKEARDCQTCVREGVNQGGQLPTEAGLQVRINYGKSYFQLAGNIQRSGAYRRLLDEENDSKYPKYGYRMIFDWERRDMSRLNAEIGREFTAGRTTLEAFGRVQTTGHKSFANIAEQGGSIGFGNKETIERPKTSLTTLDIGIRVRFKGIRAKKLDM